MAGQLGEYIITGHYIYQGKKGSQNGRVIHYSDGKLIGTIGDDNQGKTAGQEKFLFGMVQEEGKIISFMKVAPFTSCFHPVIWTMDAKKCMKGGLQKNILVPGYAPLTFH